MAELLKNIQSYWDMRAGGFSDASKKEKQNLERDGKIFSKILLKRDAMY